MQDAPPARVFSPQRLRKAVSEAGLTQQTLAFRLGRSVRGIQNWYSGTTAPKGQILELLAEVVDRDPDWFYVEPELEAVA
jgi:transcriptional regulator with XRE-family HTH domain